ncbi:MAG: hypothetical protein RIM72_12180 [Alphaproteobacteria bacterium]
MMTGFRTDRLSGLFAGLLAGSLFLIPAPATAQTVDSTTIPPAGDPAAEEDVVPLQLLPTELPSVETQTETPDNADGAAGSGIDVQALDRLDPDATGILDAATGGFPVDMWTGTPRRRLELLFSLMPDRLTAPSLQMTARRLLLSRAAVPVSFAVDGEARPSVLLTRVDKLTALGLIEDAAALLAAAPQHNDPAKAAAMAERQARLALLIGDMPGACSAMLSMEAGSAMKRRLNLTCQALAGNTTDAGFGAELIAEEGRPEDATFLALLDHLNGGPQPDPDRLDPKSALEYAMVRAAGLPLTVSEGRDDTPMMNRVQAGFPAESPEQRIARQWLAYSEGSVSLDAVTASLAAVEFDAETRANALTRAVELDSWRMTALVYQAAKEQSSPVTRAEVIGGAMILAEEGDHRRLLEAVLTPMVADIRVDRGLIWFAEDAASMLYHAGRAVEARSWFELLRTEGLQNETYDEAALMLWPYAAAAGDSAADRLGRDVAQRWIQHMRKADPDRAERGVSFVLAVLDSLGVFIPQAAWDSALAEPAVGFDWTADPAVRKALQRAAADSRLGATVALTIIALGAGDLARVDTGLLTDAIAVLREMRQENLARAIAVDAMSARY